MHGPLNFLSPANWPGKEIKRIFEFRCLKEGSINIIGYNTRYQYTIFLPSLKQTFKKDLIT